VLNPKAIGERTEGLIPAHLLERGGGVLLPFGNNQRHDLVIERQGELFKAQRKTTRVRRGTVKFAVHSTNGFTGAGTSDRGHIHRFPVWCPELDEVDEIPVDGVGPRWVSLRVQPSRQRARARLARDYRCLGVPSAGVEPATVASC
jgi:hypothetical protein